MNTKEKHGIYKDILPYISQEIKNVLEKIAPCAMDSIEEIRLRANRPLMIHHSGGDFFVDAGGGVTTEKRNLFIVKQEDILKTLALMSENSIYAYQDEIKNGFITLKGGHRVGIVGRTVLEGAKVKNIKDFSGMNIRVSREVIGCSIKVMKYVVGESGEVLNSLLVSPPGCGKTTMLRDISRILSTGEDKIGFKGIKVGIVDERSEIAACYRGVAQNDTGLRTDVLDGCPKSLGMPMLLRSMSPNVIITDEIGNRGDKEAVMEVLNAGVKIITTAHGYNISELKTRQEVLGLIEDKIFERYIVLSSYNGPGTIEEIVDGNGMKVLYRRESICC